MAQALTKIQVYGVEAQEPIFKRHMQYAILSMTGLNTDTTYDLGTYAGTFWTAVSGTDPGKTALAFFKDIALRAQSFANQESVELSTRDVSGGLGLVALLSNASSGGAATEAYTVTGLATTDKILAVSPTIATANNVDFKGYGTQVLNGLTVTYSADPGANGKITVLVERNAAAAVAGSYTISYSNKAPIITFASGDAPTTWDLVLRWTLNAGDEPIGFVADSSGVKVA